MAKAQNQIETLSRGAKAAATRAANKLEAAREEVKAIRAARRAEKKAAAEKLAAHVETVQPGIEHVSIEELFASAGADLKLPSWKRVVVGLILGVLCAGAAGYGIGMLMSYALAGIVTLTASVALQFALSVIVWVLGIYSSWKIGGYIGGKVFASVVLPDGLAARSYDSVANAASDAKAKIGGWFTSKPIVQAAQFTGAHMAGAK